MCGPWVPSRQVLGPLSISRRQSIIVFVACRIECIALSGFVNGGRGRVSSFFSFFVCLEASNGVIDIQPIVVGDILSRKKVTSLSVSSLLFVIDNVIDFSSFVDNETVTHDPIVFTLQISEC